MSDDASDDDKQHDPSQKKLDDARKKGEIPRSTDINTAAAYAGFFLASVTVGGTALIGLGGTLSGLLGRADMLSTDIFQSSAGPMAGALMLALGTQVGPLFVIPAAIVILVITAQQGFVFAPDKLNPKLNRISPLSQAKNKFGRAGLFEFLKSFTKLLIYSTVLFTYLATKLPRILGTLNLEPALVARELLEMVLGLLAFVLLVAMALGGIDLVWQRTEHIRKNRMSRKELTDEQKESEGDPAMKQQRRQKGVEIAMNQMLNDVPDADVIIVNPTHFAVALKWDRSTGAAPICVAKGVDLVAMRIREVAKENGVPIHSDPPTARALHAGVEIGQQIPHDHYRAVAVAIRFAERIRAKARK